MWAIFIIPFILLIWLMTGCTTLVVIRGAMKGPDSGVPYYLMKPDLMLKVQPPSGDSPLPLYTIETIYRPDPSHLYWVNVSPAFLTKTKFKLNFGPKGELTTANTSLQEQITPTIKSLGEFTIAAISAAAKAAALHAEEATTAIIKTLEKQAKLQDSGGTLYDIAGYDRTKKPPGGAADAREELLKRIHILKNRSDVTLEDRLYLVSETEEDWLRGTKAILQDEFKNKDQKRLDVERKKLSSAIGPEKFAELNDKWKFDDVAKSRSKEGIVRLKAIALPPKTDHQYKAFSDFFRELESFRGTYQDLLYRTVFLDKLIDMARGDPNEWRNRYVQHLEEQIATIEQERITKRMTGRSPTLDSLRKRRAQALDTTNEMERETALRNVLTKLTHRYNSTKGEPEKFGPMEEYQRAREELEKVLALMRVKRDKLKPAASPSQLLKREMTPPVIDMVDAKSLNSDDIKQILFMRGHQELPEFVISVEKGFQP